MNVYRLITRHTIEEKIMSLQDFKLKTANTVISAENASLKSMATDKVFDLFSLQDEDDDKKDDQDQKTSNSKTSIKELIENLPELWDESQYEREYDVEAFKSKMEEKK